MNTKAILGISLGAVFTITMILSPAFAGADPGTLLGGLLKDHDAGKNKNKSPAHYDLKVTSVGNYTDFAVMQTSSGTAAVGFGLINNTGYVHAFTSHSFNDCQGNPSDCGNYVPHGHGAQIDAANVNCTAISLSVAGQLNIPSIVDFGKASVNVANDESSSEIILKKIPADSQLGLDKQVCDVDAVSDVATVVAFDIVVGSGGELCVFADLPRSTTIDGADGPDNKNKAGGFDGADSQCPVPLNP